MMLVDMDGVREKSSRGRQKKAAAKRPRPFDRAGFIGFRLPADDKAEVVNLARCMRRDISSLLIEWTVKGIREKKRELGLAMAG